MFGLFYLVVRVYLCNLQRRSAGIVIVHTLIGPVQELVLLFQTAIEVIALFIIVREDMQMDKHTRMNAIEACQLV